MRTTSVRAAAAVVALLPALAACGSDEGSASDGATDRISIEPADEGEGHDHSDPDQHADGEAHSHDEAGGHGDMEGMTGEPDATPANEIEGADLAEGRFRALEGSGGPVDVGGHAWLARTEDGTTVTIDVTGLEPGADYMSHLHAETCEPNTGGDHFKFDPDGGDQPPNEVHLAFAAGDDGGAASTITNDNPASEGAKSILLHLADGTKFACADLE